ncbi:MAG: S-layer homology domain-containing protein [Clostridia bacterium]|nr:S-layer homology domain-containing protein [Clostridia bacterium]
MKLKRIFRVILSLVLLLSCTVNVGAVTKYPDVPEGEWYTEAVYEMDRANIMKGIGNGMFDPHGKLTRAMAVTVLKNLFAGYSQYVNTDGYRNVFDDVPYGTWYTDAVLWANHFKIALGRGNGKFDPDAKITRAEFCTMLTRYFDYAGLWCGEVDGVTVEITDESAIPQFAKESMVMLAKAGIINLGGVNEDGDASGRVMPDMIIDRAQCATFISRVRAKTEVKLPQMLRRLGISNLSVSIWEDHMPEPQIGNEYSFMDMDDRCFCLTADFIQPPGSESFDTKDMDINVRLIDNHGGAEQFDLKSKMYINEDDGDYGVLIYRIHNEDAYILYGITLEEGDVVEAYITFTYKGEMDSIRLPIRFYETW